MRRALFNMNKILNSTLKNGNISESKAFYKWKESYPKRIKFLNK